MCKYNMLWGKGPIISIPQNTVGWILYIPSVQVIKIGYTYAQCDDANHDLALNWYM